MVNRELVNPKLVDAQVLGLEAVEIADDIEVKVLGLGL